MVKVPTVPVTTGPVTTALKIPCAIPLRERKPETVAAALCAKYKLTLHSMLAGGHACIAGVPGVPGEFIADYSAVTGPVPELWAKLAACTTVEAYRSEMESFAGHKLGPTTLHTNGQAAHGCNPRWASLRKKWDELAKKSKCLLVFPVSSEILGRVFNKRSRGGGIGEVNADLLNSVDV